MASRAPPENQSDAPTETELDPRVRAHETCPGRTVFTDSENDDAWIATDLTLPIER